MVDLISHARIMFLSLEIGFFILEFIFYKKKNHEATRLCFNCAFVSFVLLIFACFSELIIRCLK